MSSPEDSAKVDSVERKIVQDALSKIDLQQKAVGSYFALVPGGLQWALDALVEENYDSNSTKFKNRDEFREALSRNWLVKREAFSELANNIGMRGIESTSEIIGDPNDCKFAILTATSPHLLVGAGSFNQGGPGASMEYTKIPLRHGARISDQKLSNGAYFASEFALSDRPRLIKQDGLPILKPSPITLIYVLENQSAPMLNADNISKTFIDVDAQTIF